MDVKYIGIKSLIVDGKLTSFQEIFTHISRWKVAKDLKMPFNTLDNHLNNNDLLGMKEIVGLAELMDIDPALVFNLALNDYRPGKAGNSQTKNLS